MFDINLNGTHYSYEIGHSSEAHTITKCYAQYCATNNYEYLKECFAHLHYMVKDQPPKKIIACKISHAIAAKYYLSTENIYRKFFLANSASSIIVNANLQNSMGKTLDLWNSKCSECAATIQAQGLDVNAAQEAGLAILNTN